MVIACPAPVKRRACRVTTSSVASSDGAEVIASEASASAASRAACAASLARAERAVSNMIKVTTLTNRNDAVAINQNDASAFEGKAGTSHDTATRLVAMASKAGPVPPMPATRVTAR